MPYRSPILGNRIGPGGTATLVLTRKIGEKIRIPDRNVLIKVLEIRGNSVRIGIKAPETISILRGELRQQKSKPTIAGEQSAGS